MQVRHHSFFSGCVARFVLWQKISLVLLADPTASSFEFPSSISPALSLSLTGPFVASTCPMLNPLSHQTSQDIRKRVKAGHAITYAEHAHLERGANVSFPLCVTFHNISQ